ncbi:hypothetical protein CEXT_734482 [Caerostris extrusa]|uniref:Thymidine kinase n=1 Tax=Caerostris extrusa TaxID=172846 RepID=A0AAV4N1Q4_CAEEX|nr:hypothetical protein CEXT_734482 [Caerostris extrusa]
MLDFTSKISKIVCPSQAKGHVQVIFGPMFSGKTTELIRRLKKYQIANHKCLIIKYPHDTRYSEKEISTHDNFLILSVSQRKWPTMERLLLLLPWMGHTKERVSVTYSN